MSDNKVDINKNDALAFHINERTPPFTLNFQKVVLLACFMLKLNIFRSNKFIITKGRFAHLEAYLLEPYQTSMKELFAKIVNGQKPLTIFAKKLYHR